MKYGILYLIDSLGMGGAERTLVQVLRHLDRERFEPRVCVLQQKGGNPVANEIRLLGIPLDELPVFHLRELTAIPRLTRYLRESGVHLVHTQLEFANILGTLSARLTGIPSVSTIHVLPSESAPPKTRLHNRLEGFVLRTFCDRVIAVSEQACREFLEATGTEASRVVTHYNGIDLDPFTSLDREAERIAARRELDIPEAANVLLTVAVLRPEKGIQYMIRAMPELLLHHPQTYYIIAGDGSHLQSLRVEAERAGVQNRVWFTGMRTDIPRILAAADVFVLPTMTEALPTVLMEAMASRLPILAAAVGGVPEMVEEACNGRLVPPEDPGKLAAACADLLSDPALRRSMGEQGQQIVNRKFNILTQVKGLQEIYLDVIFRSG